MNRRIFLPACLSTAVLLLAPLRLAAQEQWPPQPPWPELTLQRQGAPFGEKDKKLSVGTGGAYFFTQRQTLDKYRADPTLGRSMAEAKECVFLDEGHALTALETMYMLAGQVHDGELGDGYAVFLAAPVKQ
jgi:hypothetical protein